MDELKISPEAIADDLDLAARMDLSLLYSYLGAHKPDRFYVFDFFNRKIQFSGTAFNDLSGVPVTLAVQKVLLSYVILGSAKAKIKNKSKQKNEQMVTFRELASANPLYSDFTENTARIIEKTFTGRLDGLIGYCQEMGGEIVPAPGFDLSVCFNALPRVPVIFNFNDQEGGMPAQAGFLYQADAVEFLDLTALGITCTYLTGMLIQGR